MLQDFNPQAGALSNIHSAISPGHAVLLLISPRNNIQNHWHRPLTLNFNHQIVNSIANCLIDRPSQNSVDTILNTCPEINQAVLPSSQQGFNMNVSIYNQNWWFALMLDINTDGIVSSRLATRNIYIGLCSEDPIGNHGLASATPEGYLNPNCQLIVTRAITMRKHTTLGINGHVEKVRTTGNLEVANYDDRVFANPAIANNDYYSMLPNAVKNNVIFGEGPENEINYLIDPSDSFNVRKTERLPGELESPRMYTKNILQALETGSVMYAHGGEMGGFGAEGLEDNLSPPNARFETCANHGFQQSQNFNLANNNDPILNSGYLTLGLIVNTYSPKVDVVRSNNTMSMDIIPQDITSPNNILSTMVCSSIPSYLIQLGLSAVSFMYNSYQNATRLDHIEAAVPCSQEDLSHKWDVLNTMLRFNLYPVIQANSGEFDLQVMSNLNGTTDCRLNLLDFSPLPFGAIYREETGLGGMISPMIGTKEQLINNGVQLNSLIRNVSDYVGSNIPTEY